MLRRRKLKPLQLDPALEAWYAEEHEKQVAKAKRTMSVFDTLPGVCRDALRKEPTGSISVTDVKQHADRIKNGEVPIDNRYLAGHILQCGTTVYREFMKGAMRDMEERPVAVFRKKKP